MVFANSEMRQDERWVGSRDTHYISRRYLDFDISLHETSMTMLDCTCMYH